MSLLKIKLLSASLAAALTGFAAMPSHAAESTQAVAHTRCAGTVVAGDRTPVPADPYPLMAAGWGPELGRGLMTSRWAEDWRGVAADSRPALKAMHLAGGATLTLSAEARFRFVDVRNVRLVPGLDDAQSQFRGIVGADLRVDSHLRFYGELGTGQVDNDRAAAPANFQNRLSAQQLFVDVRGVRDDTLIGAMVGRQEFADGPRQLMSLSDGPNLHRTWNGVRLYAHAARYRMGAFELRGTQLASGGLDESIQHDTILRGLTGSVIVSAGPGPNTYLDPFWFHTELPGFRFGNEVGLDRRDTFGLRLWGRKGGLRWDWTAARQGGRSIGDRRIDAWGLFAVQSLELSARGWQPKLTTHIDFASGGGANEGPVLRNFHPLYSSSSYLGESQFLGLSNVLVIAPGVAMAPSETTTLSFEYGYARRLDADDAAYAGGMRAYPGTAGVPGHHIGDLMRLTTAWSPTKAFTLNFIVEHLTAGSVLARAGLGPGTYAQFGATYRY